MIVVKTLIRRALFAMLVTSLMLAAGFVVRVYAQVSAPALVGDSVAATEALGSIVPPDAEGMTHDSVFLARSFPVIFVVNRTEIRRQYRQVLVDSLADVLRNLGPQSQIYGRAAASPEGPFNNNRRLANGRRLAVTSLLESQGVDTTRIHFDTVIEDYMLLLEMMRQAKDPFYARAREIILNGGADYAGIKKQLKSEEKGRLWSRILAKYFPDLRATRIMITYHVDPIEPIHYYNNDLYVAPMPMPVLTVDMPRVQQVVKRPRREMLSVKTNLLGWGLVIPQYGGWCPVPNVAIEYYPKHGHFTYGASLDCPWWVGNTTNHKYMEVRNYQFEARYYLRNSDRSRPDNLEAAFKGFYLQAYAQAGLYQIGFTAKKGWIGEELGAGMGLGYVLPVSRLFGQGAGHRSLEHWRLEFGAQFGYFVTQYDPFVYGKPVYHGGEIDGLYYYNTSLYRKDFIKRQHRYSWFGPTRVGITLSYDLLYRQKATKRPSFRKWEKGAAR